MLAGSISRSASQKCCRISSVSPVEELPSEKSSNQRCSSGSAELGTVGRLFCRRSSGQHAPGIHLSIPPQRLAPALWDFQAFFLRHLVKFSQSYLKARKQFARPAFPYHVRGNASGTSGITVPEVLSTAIAARSKHMQLGYRPETPFAALYSAAAASSPRQAPSRCASPLM